MHPLVSTLQQALKPFQLAAPQPAAPLHLCVAFSGGLDSRVLLELTWQLQQQAPAAFRLRALHVHHGLSSRADAWADFCQARCQAKALPCAVARVFPEHEKGASLEARARQARYTVFSQELRKDELLLQGHHQKDQAETLLLRLLRGAGTQGLASIPESRPLGQGQLVRPLLNTPKETLEAFAHEYQLEWIEDESNQQDHFDRNYLRLNILPLLAERFPAAEQNLALTARLSQESNQLNQDLAKLDLQNLLNTQDTSLNIPHLYQLDDYRRRNLIRHWLAERHLTLPGLHQWQQLNYLCRARQDAQPLVEWGEGNHRIQARRFQNSLYINPARHFQPLPENWQTTWNNQPPLKTPCGDLALQLKNSLTGDIPQQLQVTSRQGGEKLRLQGRGSRDVKRLLQESGLPPWQRQQLPFIWQGEELIAVGSLLIAEGWNQGGIHESS